MTLLTVTDVHKNFGPLVAVDNASLQIENNQIVGLIGPNGSGKSTLLHTVCGSTLPNSGQILLEGHDITKMGPGARSRRGMAIKFQHARVYLSKSVSENLLIALQAECGLFSLVTNRTRRNFAEEISARLSDFGIAHLAEAQAGELSHGEQQWLEIAMAMARKPRLLLLDEPTAGMSAAERSATGLLIEKAAQSCGVLIVDHDLGFIRDLCQRINVMHQGVIVAEGTPKEIESDERVKEVYLTRV